MKKLMLVITILLALLSANILPACNGGSEQETPAVERVVAKSTAINVGGKCSDLNNDGLCNTATEDNSGPLGYGVPDGFCTVLDCQGAPGAAGKDGTNGTNCWDANLNGDCDPAEAAKAAPFDKCGPEDCVGANGLNNIVKITPEPAGANCANGGVKLESGLDANSNGVLDTTEISSVGYTCSLKGDKGDTGANGLNALVQSSAEPAGANCANGGVKFQSGSDANSNGVLDTAEVANTFYACSLKGDAGKDGVAWLPRMIPLPGATTTCSAGGYLLQWGPDANGNGILDDSEVWPSISAGYQICNGTKGADGTNGSNGSTCVPQRVVETDTCGWNCGLTAEQIALAATLPEFACPRVSVKDNDGDCIMAGTAPADMSDIKLVSDNPVCGTTVPFTWGDTNDVYSTPDNGLACYNPTTKVVVMFPLSAGGCENGFGPSFTTSLGSYNCSEVLTCGAPLTCDTATHLCTAPAVDGDADSEVTEGDTDSTESEVSEDGDVDTTEGDTDSTESEVSEDGDVDTTEGDTDTDSTTEIHPRFAMKISVAGLTLYNWGEAGKFLGSRVSVAGINEWIGTSGNGSIVLGGTLPAGATCTCYEDGFDPWACATLFTGSFGCGTLGPVPEVPVGGDID